MSGRADRITRAFAAGRGAGRPLVIPFVTAGYPRARATVPLVIAMGEAGVDMVEIGMPFSDPLADGPTIQRASEVALRNGMNVAGALAVVRQLRDGGLDLPLVLMGYCNPLYAYGLERFLDDAAGAGVDGLIVPDMPPEEAGELLAGCRRTGVSATFLVAPNAPDDRIRTVDAASTHFSYCVSITGVTGARSDVEDRTAGFLQRVRRLAAKPFVVGFGIKRPEHVAALGPHADGVVIGSALIDAIEAAGGAEAPEERAAQAVAELLTPLCEQAERLAVADGGGDGSGGGDDVGDEGDSGDGGDNGDGGDAGDRGADEDDTGGGRERA